MENKTASPAATLLVTTLAGFFSSFAASSVNVALPSIGREWSIDAVTLNWIVTVFTLVSAALMIPMGRAADIFGRKRIFTIGILLYMFAGIAAAFAPNIAVLIAARGAQGAGGAMLFSTSTAILISVYPPEKRGRVLGINVASIYIGLSAGPFIGGILTHQLGWRSVFWISVLLGIVTLPLVLTRLHGEWRESKGETLDIPGAALYATSLSLLIIGFSRIQHVAGALLSAAGLAGLMLFIILENRSKHPMVHVELFTTNRGFAMSSLAALISYAATFSVAFFLSLYLQSVKGYSAQQAGLIMVVQPLLQAAFSPLTGRLSDRVEPSVLSSLGMAVTVAGLVMLAFLNAVSPVWQVLTALGLLGTGFSLFSSPNTNAIMSSVEKSKIGFASATLATMRTVGQVVSMAAALLLTSVFVGKGIVTPEHPDAFLSAMRTGFGIFAVLCFLGIFASLVRGKVKRPEMA